METHPLPDCSAVLQLLPIAPSGEYTVYPSGVKTKVFCDMETDGGGWTVLMKRFNGSVSFNRNWAGMRGFFGDLRGEFWIGLQTAHLLTKQGNHELRFDMAARDHSSFAAYTGFRIASEDRNFRLFVTGYQRSSTETYDAFINEHNMNGSVFSTNDRPNGKRFCVDKFKAPGWWNNCAFMSMFGSYGCEPDLGNREAMHWYKFGRVAERVCLASMEIKMRKM